MISIILAIILSIISGAWMVFTGLLMLAGIGWLITTGLFLSYKIGQFVWSYLKPYYDQITRHHVKAVLFTIAIYALATYLYYIGY